MIFEKKFKPE